MAEETKKTETKKAPAKKAPAKKEAAPKAETQKASAPKAKKPAGQTITVRQIGSPIGREAKQRQTLIGLGLNKMYRTRTLEDTPSVRGMVRKIPHLVEIVEDAA